MEQYESKHSELNRSIEFFRYNAKAWMESANRQGCPKKAAYARRTSAIYSQLGKDAQTKLNREGEVDFVKALVSSNGSEFPAAVVKWRKDETKWMEEMVWTQQLK